jgi:hypothetical protein
MFMNQGLGVACVGSLALGPRWLLTGSPALLWVIGAGLGVVGITIKVWATVVVVSLPENLLEPEPDG